MLIPINNAMQAGFIIIRCTSCNYTISYRSFRRKTTPSNPFGFPLIGLCYYVCWMLKSKQMRSRRMLSIFICAPLLVVLLREKLKKECYVSLKT